MLLGFTCSLRFKKDKSKNFAKYSAFSSFLLIDVVLTTGLGLDLGWSLKSCGLKTKKALRPFLDLKDLKILILDKAKLD